MGKKKDSLTDDPSSKARNHETVASEVFEIQDFTIATDWEKFIADVEAILRKWLKEPPSNNSSSKSNKRGDNTTIHQETIAFESLKGSFLLTYFHCHDQLSSIPEPIFTEREWEQQWLESIYPIQSRNESSQHANLFKFVNWFGFTQFIFIQPRAASGSHALSQSQAHLVLSSVHIALTNFQKKSVPIFVPVRDQWRDEYIGIANMIHHYNQATETEECIINMHSEANFSSTYSLPTRKSLINLFVDHMGIPKNKVAKMSLISRQSYFRRPRDMYDRLVDEVGAAEEILAGFEGSGVQDDLQFIQEYNNIFFGPTEDPIHFLRLIACWKHEGTCKQIEEKLEEPLVVSKAPCWSLQLKLEKCIPNQTQYCLTNTIRSFLSSLSSADTLHDSVETASSNIRTSNKQLPLITAVSLGLKLLKSPRFPSTKEIDTILGQIFNHKADKFLLKPDDVKLSTDPYYAPSSSLLSLLVSNIMNLEGLPAICALWKEFVKEIRWHWEQSPPAMIPYIEIPTEAIDLRRCLIYQKLQMLNYCAIKCHQSSYRQQQTKQQSNPHLSSSSNSTSGTHIVSKQGWDIDIEFTVDSDSESQSNESVIIPTTSTTSTTSTSSETKNNNNNKKKTKREGEKSLMQPLTRLVAYLEMEEEKIIPEEHCIWIPETQSFGVLTDDMIEEQQHTVNPSQQHHAQLLADMEAFKAANPGCYMADFVRWYSPADWIGTEQEEATENDTIANYSANTENEQIDIQTDDIDKNDYPGFGKLSTRMRAAGNTWRLLWQEAVPRSIDNQKPLFDYKKEGEKAIHYLETLSSSELMMQLLGIVFRESLNTLCCSPAIRVKSVQQTIQECATITNQILAKHFLDPEDCEALVILMSRAEQLVSQADSLLVKFENQYDLCEELFLHEEVILESEASQNAVHNYFYGEQGIGPVEEQEFVLQARVQLPNSPLGAPPVLQRLFAHVTNHEYRIATAYSSVQ